MLYKFSIILLALYSCEHNNNKSDQTLNTNNPIHSVSIDSIKYSDYINSLPISKLPDGFSKTLSQTEIKPNDDSGSYNWIGLTNKYYQINYKGAQTYDICMCNPNDREQQEIDSFYIFKRLQPINDTIETLLLLEDKSGKLDIITINKYDKRIIDSLNLWDANDGDFSIFKLFYIDEEYKITIKSFWSYEGDGHPSPFERSKCQYKINSNGNIVSFFDKPNGIVDVKLETIETGKSMYHTFSSGEVKNHLKNGKWIEKRMIYNWLNVASGEYKDGVKKGQWIYSKYYSNLIELSIDTDWRDLYTDLYDTIIH